jgi:hypothetical protein
MSSRRTASFTDVFIYSLRTRQFTRLHANSVADRDPASVDWSTFPGGPFPGGGSSRRLRTPSRTGERMPRDHI